ncbi:extracellular solute-binding protein [Planktotalea arctica]|uniref:extracellular solute-binding protein n=1 Tax=Planktotalea arctica TaxID=1481893 RepID=UPI003D2F6F30
MRSLFFARRLRLLALIFAVCVMPVQLASQPSHGIAMYGAPALPHDFVSLPYANPDAPKGGRISFGEVGSFDSLNPHIRKGSVPWQLRSLAYESLMGRSYGEPFTLYGLLAESVETDPNRTWVEFTLRKEATFSDGSPVTTQDVIWSYETLGTVGHPRYRGLWAKIEAIEATGPRSVRITFNEANRELALIAGLRPILKKAQWQGKDFANSTLDEIPISSSPYVISDVDPGRSLTLRRNPEYWGKNVPFRRGTMNLDEIRMEFYGDSAVLFEAFKAGELNMMRENNAEKWETQYNFPAAERGDVIKSAIPHQRPTGMTGFVMNTRRAPFDDWRVRDAMIHAFNFEFINDTLTGGRQPRISSYFSNSVLGLQEGPATGKVAELLAPYAPDLLPGAMNGYTLPVADGSARNRKNIRAAMKLLQDAGYSVQDGKMIGPDGKQLSFEVLLRQGNQENQAIMDIYGQALERLGIAVQISATDDAQYTERTATYDFDMTYYRIGLSLSPGNEQMLYWGREGVDTPGRRNWMGMDVPAAEAMVDAILGATSQEDFIAASRALDRILISGRYFIPLYQWPYSNVAHAKELRFPETLPIYGDWLGFLPEVWWWQDN